MKRLFLLVTAAATLSAAARQQTQEQTQQAQEPRNLKLIVRNTKDKVMRGASLMAQVKGSDEILPLDRFGNCVFRVTDADTLVVIMPDRVYEFPVAGYDSLRVVLKNRSRIAGYTPGDAGDELIDIGYGVVSRRNNTSSVSTLDMAGVDGYSDLKAYIMGRVSGVNFMGDQLVIRGINSINSGIEALIVVDGVSAPSFAAVNESINPRDVASISVLKDAGSTAIYGTRGANGVVLITTKRGGE